jgi:hypothetical protein
MHDQAIAAARWLSAHRYQLALLAALVCLSALVVAATPLLLVVSAIEWKQARKGQRLLALMLITQLIKAVVWLWLELHDAPHGRWHPCAQCGRPIEAPSRAAYCSPACRRYARLERDAAAADPRVAEAAERRLRALRLRRLADERPEWKEVPF